MRALILLTTVWCCSAQLVYHGYPWAPLATPLLATPKLADGEELKTVPLVSPYFHPFHTGFPLATGLPLTYSVKLPESTLEATEFPYIYTEKESSRRKRDVAVPLPYFHAVPTVKEVSFETKQFEPIEAAVPASTTKIELTTKEHTVNVPAVKYVQPVVNYKPVTYTAQSVVPYAGLPLAYSGLHHAGLPLAYSGLNHAGLPLTYSGLHHTGLPLTYSGIYPFGLSPYAPLIKIEEAAEESEEEVVESARRKRDLTTVKLPYLHVVPTTKAVTFETKGFEAVEAAVPASTTKIELTTKEHTVNVPAVKYVQPVVSYKPVTYTAQSVVPYAGLPFAYSGLHHAGFPLTYSGLHHTGLPLTYSGIHPFGLSPYAPLIKIEEAAEESEEEVVESARRKRDLTTVKLPYLHAVPTTKTVTFETKGFEPVEAAVPASTTKIELTTKEHEVVVPAVKYVQPVVSYKPVTYTAQSVVPYAGLPLTYSGLHHAGLPLAYSGLHHAGLPLTYSGLQHAGLPLTYSGLHPFGAPLVKLNTAEAAEE